MGHQATSTDSNPYGHLRKSLEIRVPGEEEPFVAQFFDVAEGFSGQFGKLPYSIRVLLEAAVRKCDNRLVKEVDVDRIAGWGSTQDLDVEIQFSPARVVLQDFTGVPCIVDLAAMRDAVLKLGGNPDDVNPVCPTDLVIDHSVQVDYYGDGGALERNQELEFTRNHERFAFLKWGATAFKNMLIVPPGNGIVHQVNLEYLGRVVFKEDLLFPDSVVGTDSHTTMINGLGVLGWGVGGIEAEAVMMGLPMSMVLPKVVGYKLFGDLNPTVTSTDLVLTITKNLRSLGVVGKFVEFFGPGLANLSIADRATISNMCPEYGATCAFFPVDAVTLQYLRQTNRSERDIAIIEAYLKRNKLFRGEDDAGVEYTQVVELDLGGIVTCVSGPKRPHDRVSVFKNGGLSMKEDFLSCLRSKIGFKGYGIPEDKIGVRVPFTFDGKECSIGHGSVLLAAITSCTNTSNPSVMLGAGLVARKAVQKGLSVPKFVKTSLSPGSGVVSFYLQNSGVIGDLKALGFDLVGYGCMTCIGNSGNLAAEVEEVLEKSDLVCCGVLSGNRNFEGRIHPLLRANYLASPLLVIAYALAGRVDIDFETEPIQNGVFLRDIWPSREEIRACEEVNVLPSMFKSVYSKIQDGNPRWNSLEVQDCGATYAWDEESTYIRRAPFMDNVGGGGSKSLSNAFCLLLLGDSVTTDHISPAGSIARNSPAARYLSSKGLTPREFNSYGSRRGNDLVMARGTFANIRLVNKLNKNSSGEVVPGPRTLYIPTGEVMDVYDASVRYSAEFPDTPLIVIAGKDYGSGSSRDWAAKGPALLNVKVVIAESYERIHRSNLVGMGILPLQFSEGESAESLGLTGLERFSVETDGVVVKGSVGVVSSCGKRFVAKVRIDTDVEMEYYGSGGILPFLVKRVVGGV